MGLIPLGDRAETKKKIKMPFTRVCETFIFEFLIGKMKSEFG